MRSALPALPTLSAATLALACAVAGSVQAAGPRTYALDPVHTRVMVAVEHAGFSRAIGTVSGSTGTLTFDTVDDGIDWSSARLDVRIPVARIDFGDEDWNRAVRAGRLLDTADHPEAHFVADRIEPRDDRQARICGTLALRGATGPVCLEVAFNQLRRHPLPPFRRTAGFSATGTLDRTAFGIDAWPGVIGQQVELRIEAEAVLARGAPGEDTSGDDSTPDDATQDATPLGDPTT